MAVPPVLVGAVHLAVAVMAVSVVTPSLAVPMTGAPGTVVVVVAATGVTEFEAADNAPTPAEFTARTRKLYAVPLFRPVTTLLVAVPAMPVTVRRTVPAESRTWIRYSVIGAPPVFVGAFQFTVAVLSP